MSRIWTALGDVLVLRRLCFARDNDGLMLCRCDACVVKEDHKSVYQRTDLCQRPYTSEPSFNPKDCPVDEDGPREHPWSRLGQCLLALPLV